MRDPCIVDGLILTNEIIFGVMNWILETGISFCWKDTNFRFTKGGRGSLFFIKFPCWIIERTHRVFAYALSIYEGFIEIGVFAPWIVPSLRFSVHFLKPLLPTRGTVWNANVTISISNSPIYVYLR